jgi:hypothetical protein
MKFVLPSAARTSGNRVIQAAIMAARASIREGETISAPLKESNVFPPMVVQMISVGEETGALDDMLTRIADFYDSEVDTAVDSLTSLIEPIMIVFMGGIVGGMVVAMYLPMFKLINVVAGGLIQGGIPDRAERPEPNGAGGAGGDRGADALITLVATMAGLRTGPGWPHGPFAFLVALSAGLAGLLIARGGAEVTAPRDAVSGRRGGDLLCSSSPEARRASSRRSMCWRR